MVISIFVNVRILLPLPAKVLKLQGFGTFLLLSTLCFTL